jgi:phage I-like protein
LERVAKLLQLEQGMAAMDNAPRTPPKVYVNNDPVEQLASQLSAQSAAWVRAHPEYARDPRKTQEMVAAHNLVTARGHRPDTPEYFDNVEKILGVNSSHESPLSSASDSYSNRVSPPAAPVTRSMTTSGQRTNIVRLSAEEREMAQMMGMTPEDYARNKLALKRAGKIH